MLPKFTGYWLDDYTFACPMTSSKDPFFAKWAIFKMSMPRKEDGSIQYDPLTGTYFEVTILDDNNEFEWKGMKCKICITENQQKSATWDGCRLMEPSTRPIITTIWQKPKNWLKQFIINVKNILPMNFY